MPISRNKIIAELSKNSQRKAISLGTLTALLVAILIWFSFKPTVLTISEVISKNEFSANILTKLEEKNSNLTAIITEQQALNDSLIELQQYFPYDTNFSLFMVNLDEGATQNKFFLQSINFNKTESNEVNKLLDMRLRKLEPIVFNISLLGDTNNLQNYLNFLNNLPYGVRITNVSFQPSTSKKSSIFLSLVVYKLKKPLVDNGAY